ncbi:unnamed protein product, partial [Nesidiocoris tenuis]
MSPASNNHHSHHVFLSTEPTENESSHYGLVVPHEDEQRIENLFKSLDCDGNGRIDIHDLSEALRNFGVAPEYAQ